MDNIKVAVIDEQGRHRGYKLWIVCPHCSNGRWVREDTTKVKTFTGFCNKCHAKYTTGQYDKHSRWKGGRRKQSDGYILVKLKRDDPYSPMARNSGYVREHRLVMAQSLGRCLHSWEVVHHKGTLYPMGSLEDRGDNRLENLELITSGVYHLLDSNYKGQMTRKMKNYSE